MTPVNKNSKSSRSRSWPDYLKSRLKRLRQRFDEASLGGLLVTNPVDIRYLTGFIGEDSWLLVTDKSVYLFSDFRFQEEIEAEQPYVTLVLRSGSMAEAFAEKVAELKLSPIGFQAGHLTVQLLNKIESHLESTELAAVEDWLLEQRAVKDDAEIKLIKKAVFIQEQAYVQTLELIQPDMSEMELTALLEYNMRYQGADGASFPTIVAIDANASRPHAVPGHAKVKDGSIVLIDFGAKFGGYCSDLTRVVGVGSMPEKIKEIYKVVLEAQHAAITAVKPGVKLSEIDARARQVIEAAGYGDYFGHGTGHGIGLDIHESPRLAKSAEGELVPGNVVTVEPGIYLPGIGGVRIEDDVVVTNKGRRKISTLPTDLESAII